MEDNVSMNQKWEDDFGMFKSITFTVQFFFFFYYYYFHSTSVHHAVDSGHWEPCKNQTNIYTLMERGGKSEGETETETDTQRNKERQRD